MPDNRSEGGRPGQARLISDIAGIILAGGRSSRFGTDKALTRIENQPMIVHIVNRLRPIFSSLLIVTNSPDVYRFLKIPMTGDLVKEAGPLAGIHAALSATSLPRAFITACDMPMLDEKLIRYLCAIDDRADAVIPYPGGRPEPLHAVYNRRVRQVSEQLLSTGERSLGRLISLLAVYRVEHEEILRHTADLASFANINRPEDLAELEKHRFVRR